MWQVYVIPGISTMTTFKYYMLGIRQLINVRKKKKKEHHKFCLLLYEVV